MGKASRDQNNVTTVLGTWANDGVTPIPLLADPVTHAVMVDFGTTGSDLGIEEASRDPNFVTTILGASRNDGVTPVPIFFTSGGSIKLDNT